MRLGMIGVGGRGALYRHWHADERVEIVAGADTNPAALKTFAEEVGGPDCYEDYRRVLDRDDVDAVAVCTPDWLHAEHAIASLGAGKHLFCEKPLAITIDDCDRILRDWQASGRRMMVGFNMRYMRYVSKMKELVDAGLIGEVKTAWCRHFVSWGGRFYYHDWHANRRNTTGLLLQKGTHDIDVMHWICSGRTVRTAAFGALSMYGAEHAPPTVAEKGCPDDLRCRSCEIAADCPEEQAKWDKKQDDLCAFRSEVDVEDNSTMIMQLDNGIQAAYLECHFAPGYERNYAFIGSEGMIESDEPHGKVYFYKRTPGPAVNDPTEVYETVAEAGEHGGADPVIARDFVNMVVDGVEPRAEAVAGRWSVAAGVCATESLRSRGMPVDVPPLPPDLKHLE
jgi:predicted dehydrogenase